MANGKSAAPVLLLLFLAVAGMAAWVHFRHRSIYLEPLPRISALSPAIDIDVYVDGSKSMRNFLKPGTADNRFKSFLQHCELALKSGYTRGGWDVGKRNVRVFKFGPKDGPKLLSSSTALNDLAENPDEFDADNTSIEDAFRDYQSRAGSAPTQPANAPAPLKASGHLMIIVTDLFESDGELQKPGLALADQFLRSDKGAVAVYGIRTPFEGRVSDIPGQARRKIALPDAASSMPFYIILAGDNAADVRHAQEVLTSGEYGEPLQKAMKEGQLFAAYFSKSAGRYSHARVVYDPRVYEKDHLLRFSADPATSPRPGEEGSAASTNRRAAYSARVLDYQPDYRDGIARFELVKRPAKENYVGVSWPPEEAENGPIWQTAGTESAHHTEWSIHAFACRTAKPGPDSTCDEKQQEADQKALKGIHICYSGLGAGSTCQVDGTSEPDDAIAPTQISNAAATQLKRRQPALAVLIDRRYLIPRCKYLLEFDEVSTSASQVDSFNASNKVMKKWNLTPAEADQLLTQKFFPAGDSIDDKHSGKTPNLAEFLTALNGRVMSSDSGSADATVPLKTFFLYLTAR